MNQVKAMWSHSKNAFSSKPIVTKEVEVNDVDDEVMNLIASVSNTDFSSSARPNPFMSTTASFLHPAVLSPATLPVLPKIAPDAAPAEESTESDRLPKCEKLPRIRALAVVKGPSSVMSSTSRRPKRSEPHYQIIVRIINAVKECGNDGMPLTAVVELLQKLGLLISETTIKMVFQSDASSLLNAMKTFRPQVFHTETFKDGTRVFLRYDDLYAKPVL